MTLSKYNRKVIRLSLPCQNTYNRSETWYVSQLWGREGIPITYFRTWLHPRYLLTNKWHIPRHVQYKSDRVVIPVSNEVRMRWKLVHGVFLGREDQIWRQILKLTKTSLIIHTWWHTVTLLSNKIRIHWKLVHGVFLGRGDQIWCQILKLTKTSLISTTHPPMYLIPPPPKISFYIFWPLPYVIAPTSKPVCGWVWIPVRQKIRGTWREEIINYHIQVFWKKP